ncbi:MAG TPA: glycosyltransferase family 1 protein [Ferruginibacter sp.]|nr:glycosyltransferase family 1 protein [Ferruginibacter sp.]
MYKITLDCDLMRYRDSGLYHYCLNLGSYVKEALNRESEGRIVFYIPPAERGSFGNDAHCIIEKKWHLKFFKPFLWDCDIWHAPFQSGRIIVPPKNKRVKVLLTIHDLNCLHEGKSPKEQRESLNKTQRLIDRADAIVCISHHCKSDVLTHMETGNKPVHVIHNGTHNVTVPPPAPAGYMPVYPFIFSMGYVNPKKNFHTLVPLLKNKEIELVVAGKLDDAEYVNSMRIQARKLGVSERLHILGPVSEEDKAWYFKNCMAFALPSLAEGFGAPVVEAMKFGKPIFLSNLTSLPEIGSDVSFYFNSFEPDHMQQVFSEGMFEYQRNGLAKRVEARGHEFGWHEKAMDYLKVYRSLL